jgi:DNA-binding response OmpR family regulator
MQAILVARDPDERELVTYLLRHAGLAVATTPELQRVAAKWLERPADIIVVAVDSEGELAADIAAVRAVTQVPLLVLSEPLTEVAHCDLLTAGADLVLIRPVAPRILTQYTRTLLRRGAAVPPFLLSPLDLAAIQLDPATRTVAVGDKEPQRLTQLEFRLLYVLMTNREHVVPVEAIVERVWGYTGDGNRDLVRGLVSRLRRKIEPSPELPRFIQTIAGVGYRFSLNEGTEG